VDQLYHRYLERQKTRHIAYKLMWEIPYNVFNTSMFVYDPRKCLGPSYLFDTTNKKDVLILF
jgi:flavin-dependent dehydrogenase